MTTVETSTPPNTPQPIGPYSHIAKVGQFMLPKPGILLTMNLTAVANE